MASIEVALTIKVDGLVVPDCQLVRRLEVDEATRIAFEQATGGGSLVIPGTDTLDELQFLFLKPNKQMTLRLDGQLIAGLVINANGFVLLFDVDIDADATVNAKLDNSAGSTALVKALAGGT